MAAIYQPTYQIKYYYYILYDLSNFLLAALSHFSFHDIHNEVCSFQVMGFIRAEDFLSGKCFQQSEISTSTLKPPVLKFPSKQNGLFCLFSLLLSLSP